MEKCNWKNIIDENERWLDETGGDRSKLKMFHNCEFKPISIKSEKENEEIIKTFPPVHYSLDGHEATRKFKVKRNLGSDEHLKRALKSHISFNSLRVGSPDRLMSIRKSSPRSALAL